MLIQDHHNQYKITHRLNLKERKIKETDWTFEEFEKVKKEFLSGKRIKIIAYEIGRSETAINKFLSRAGIRKAKVSKNSSFASKHGKQKKFELSEHVRGKVYKNEVCVNFDEVISYLSSLGHNISKNKSFKSIFYTNEEYLLNYKPVSKIKLLLFSNKLRLEENKPIFKLLEMRW